jgi:NTP pyrophosphatase (non-canonical NTP hydrolase)
MDYNKLSKQAHEDAKANGWYEKVQPINTYLALIKSELYEALDAFRGDKYVNHTRLSMLYTYIGNEDYLRNLQKELIKNPKKQSAGVNNFKFGIKDTFEDEIADTAIRIFDFCGWYGIELPEPKKIQTKVKGQFPSDLIAIDKLITGLFDVTDKEQLNIVMSAILGALESIAEVYQFDLEQHIALKMAYNKTRGHKHGGKVL